MLLNNSNEDYVTRTEFDEAVERMRVYGDGNTIEIDENAGGSVARCIIPFSAPSPYVDEPIFTSSYDATADTYTIRWRDFYVWASYFGDVSGTSNKRYWSQEQVSAGQFVFNATVYTTTSKLYIQPTLEVTSAPYLYGCSIDLKWGGSLTGSDTDTQNAQIDDPDADKGRIGQNICVLSGGSDASKAALVVDGQNLQMPVVEFGYAYDKQTTTISMPIQSQYSGDSQPDFWSKNIGTSFDDELILGWTASPTDITFDALANSGSYDDYQKVGYAKTDASGWLTAAVKYSDYLTGTFGISGFRNAKDIYGNNQTVGIEHGLIYRWDT